MTSLNKKAVVVYKRSLYEFYVASQDSKVQAFLSNNREAERLKTSHHMQRETLDHVLSSLDAAQVSYDAIWRGNLREIADVDVAIVIGGDGTFIETSHYVKGIPVLGVNSDPQSSRGFFCAATKENFKDFLYGIDTAPRTTVHRMKLSLDDKEIPSQVLNDILIAHENPSAMTRYKLDGTYFRGSGLLASTAAGSTAWIYEEGGKVVPLSARDFQYFHRGIRNGKPQFAGRLSVESLTRKSKMYIDGEHLVMDFPIGSMLEISQGVPLAIIGDIETKRKTCTK